VDIYSQGGFFAFDNVEIGPCEFMFILHEHTFIYVLSIPSCFVCPLGKESLPFAVHPKRNKLLCIYPDIHPNTTITQYVICNSLSLLLNSYLVKVPIYEGDSGLLS